MLTEFSLKNGHNKSTILLHNKDGFVQTNIPMLHINYVNHIRKKCNESWQLANICLLIPQKPLGLLTTQRLIRKGVEMKVRIEDICTACGLCCDTCPEVFEMGDEFAEVIIDEVPEDLEDTVQQAVDECPVEAIIIEE